MFPDLSHLNRVSEALWQGRAYGQAAVMIGAGFSMNALPARSSARLFPTWPQLTTAIFSSLYPGATPEETRGAELRGALRLAEEYKAAHGKHALEDLLLKTIPDEDHHPGPLHRLLLKLPWSDVFTTNYDTLLERAARTLPYRRYHIVTSASEIPSAMRPRIVKLHGSFPSGRPFVLTEEDFRIYGRRCAPMVNMAQQSIIENIFCLIGFSGDDPNFLQWTGWARDNLGNDVRQIYLVGILNLTSPQRKMLNDRHVMPIDLSPLFPPDRWPDHSVRHARALEWFLLALEAAQPPNPLAWPESVPLELTPPSVGLPDRPKKVGSEFAVEKMGP